MSYVNVYDQYNQYNNDYAVFNDLPSALPFTYQTEETMIFKFPEQCYKCEKTLNYVNNIHCFYCKKILCNNCRIKIDISSKITKDLANLFNEYIGDDFCEQCFNKEQIKKEEIINKKIDQLKTYCIIS